MEWNGGMDWTGLDWTGMEWPDKLGSCGRVRPLPLKFGCTGCLVCLPKAKIYLQTHLIMISGTDLALSPGPFS